MHILGVRVDEVTQQEAIERAEAFLQQTKPSRIFTPNPEILVAATKYPSFREILNTADLSLCDGKGLEFFGKKKLVRIPGVDFVVEILKLAERENKSVFLLGSGNTQTLKGLFQYIQTTFPTVRIAGMHPGPMFFIDQGSISFTHDEDRITNDKVLREISKENADILFVAFGHYKQELWIHTYAEELKNVRVVMGVGGAFDYLSGRVSRAPLWLRLLGLEWLYRFFTQPKRFFRIITAVIIFPYYAFIKNR
jgi:N-acetylglucosaminyldiphosphoundecaprenol N-acetyl-beta-D-mannosaminyltransferase